MAIIEEIVEDVWDCSSCKTHGILGREMKCPACGNAKDPSDVDRSVSNEAVTDPALLKLANAGPNWTCEFCGGDSRAAHTNCMHDGAPKEVKMSMADRVAKQEADREREILNFKLPPVDPLPSSPFVSASGGSPMSGPLIGGGFMIAMIMLLFYVFSPSSEKVTLFSASWQRTVNIEHQVDVIDEAWDAAPVGARIISNTTIPAGGGYQTRVVGTKPGIKTWTEKVENGVETYYTTTEVPDGFTVTYTNDQVFDGYETFNTSKQIPDGFKTEYDRKRVQVGTKKVEISREKLKNGFSKVKYDEQPVYETKSVPRQVQQYKTVQIPSQRKKYKTVRIPHQTPKTRTVSVPHYRPKFIDVPRTMAIMVPDERQFPIPRVKVRYATLVWRSTGSPLTRTGTDMNPLWPDVNLKSSERESGRAESFELVFRGKSDYRYRPGSFAEFSSFHMGDKYRVKVSGGSIVSFEGR